MSSLRIVAAALLAASLVACSSSVVRDSGSRASGVAISRPKPGATTLVQRGDNLYRIASSNGITVRDLAAWNGIPIPYTIYPGQRLRL